MKEGQYERDIFINFIFDPHVTVIIKVYHQLIRKGFQILFQLNVIAAIYVLEQNMQGMSDAANLRPRTSAFFPLHYHMFV